MFNFGTGTWKTVDDYPFGSGSFVVGHDLLYIPETSSYLIIGGSDGPGKALFQIAKFKDVAWFDAGRSNSAHNVSFRLVLFQIYFVSNL